ncbi:MAG: IclR family transcriptional regulator domain-containing protein [Galactobacter sp.]
MTTSTGVKAAAKESELFVQSLARGLATIEAFDAQHPELTLSEVATRSGVSRASARRFLHTLVDLGFAATDGRLFRLTPRVLRLGYAYLASQPLPGLVGPYLQELSDQVGESVSASELDGSEVVYVARVQTRRIMHVAIGVGTRFPAATTSMGRVLLAGLPPAEALRRMRAASIPALTARTLTSPEAVATELDRVREQGWCLVDQELEAGLRSVAAPVHGPDGTVVCAVNVSLSVAGSDDDASAAAERVLAPLLQCASDIEAALARR